MKVNIDMMCVVDEGEKSKRKQTWCELSRGWPAEKECETDA